MGFRVEKDLIGEKNVPSSALYGIHTARAMENFCVSGIKLDPVFIKSMGLVKKACLTANFELGYIAEDKFRVISQAVDELIDNRLDSHILVDALQGGAGTSTNMNINEVIANRALEIAGKDKGDYEFIHPLRDINMHQSTNDVYPTAMKVAAILLLNSAETAIADLQNELQQKEKEFARIIKVARTELQDAVPMTLGRTFSAYADAIGRDRWRIFKCKERLRTVNLGGTMIGTGISAPRDYIFTVTDKLRDLTGLNLSRAENLIDATQNHDSFVEVSGILKAHAATMRKIASDLRFLSCGPKTGIAEIELAPLQAGSSIMPGKVNPVILEMVEQCAVKIIANDFIITETASRGELELNSFLPLLCFALIESLNLIINMACIFTQKCVKSIRANELICRKNVEDSLGALTGLVPLIGYDTVQKIASQSAKTGESPVNIIVNSGIMSKEDIGKFLTPENFNKLGFDRIKSGGGINADCT